MTALVFKRTAVKPTTLTKGVVQFVAKNTSQAELYVGSNSNTPLQIVGAGSEAGFYSCSAWKEGNSTTPVTGTVNNYNVVWNNDGQLNTTTGVYTVPTSGLYCVEFEAIKHNTIIVAEVRLYKNGSPTGVKCLMASKTTGEYEYGHLKAMGNFTTGDKLDIRVTSGGLLGHESCYLNIYKVR